MRVIIKGAGEMATGVAHRLHQSGFEIIMTDITQPTTIRRRVAFSRAIGEGKAEIEGVVARRTSSDEIGAVLENGDIAVVPSRDGSWYGSGLFYPLREIGQRVEEEEIIAQTGDLPVAARVSGILRGILPKGTPVHHGMKAGEIDPDCQPEDCFTISAEARAVGGAVLEAILHLGNKQGVKDNKGW